MAICITFGTHEFTSMLEGYEHVRAYCQNCHNWNGHCITRWPFFTICFVPVIPLATHKYKEVKCYTCQFAQDLSIRPDVTPDTRPPPQPYGHPPGPWGPQYPPQAAEAHGAQKPVPNQGQPPSDYK